MSVYRFETYYHSNAWTDSSYWCRIPMNSTIPVPVSDTEHDMLRDDNNNVMLVETH
jgi:hypothetical protein